MSLAGKCVVVTGSNSGIGLGVAEEMARLGADVVLNSFTDRPEDHALAERIAAEHGVRAIYVPADMADGDACRALVTRAAEAMGRVDILVNNAGIQHVAPIPDFPVDEMGPDHRDQPLLGLPHHRRGAAADARAGLGPNRQHRLGARPDRLAVQVRLRRGQARHRRLHQGGRARDRRGADHLQRHLPGLRADPARRGADPRHDEAVRHDREQVIRDVLLQRQPSKQFATVEQIGGCVAFLCSPAAEQITGTALSIDGGWTAL